MKNEFLRHSVATIDYRFAKVIEGQEAHFGEFSAGEGCRTTNQIINHMFEVLHATRVFIEEERFIKDKAAELGFSEECTRFQEELKQLDVSLSNNELPINFGKRLIQGPISDIFTHIGQISMMSRLNGKAIEGEDFSSAPIGTFGT